MIASRDDRGVLLPPGVGNGPDGTAVPASREARARPASAAMTVQLRMVR